MDHETAVRLQAAERYLLGEFPPEQRMEFEEHFFGCPDCASEVRAASILDANLKAVLRDEQAREAQPAARPARRPRLFWPLLASAAVNAALVAGIGIRLFQPVHEAPAAVEPQFYRTFGVPAASRGDSPVLEIPAGSRFFGARFDLLPGPHFESFVCRILDARGSLRSERTIAAPPGAASELELAIPVASLEPGQYQLILQGLNQNTPVDISSVRFRIGQ